MQFFPIKKSAHGGIFLVLTTFSNFCSIFYYLAFNCFSIGLLSKNIVSLPGDCRAALAMTECVARIKSNKKTPAWVLKYSSP